MYILLEDVFLFLSCRKIEKIDTYESPRIRLVPDPMEEIDM